MHIVLLHGWSVFDTSTYGELPARLVAESRAGRLPGVTVQTVWLGRYVSFRDEVQLDDLALGLEEAFKREVKPHLKEGERFACITHSTGGPIARHWWWRFYRVRGQPCPLSHLVMLAPANFGSPLAQLGKGRLSRLRSWVNSVEPGQGVLDWLEQGSDPAWDLNLDWIIGSAQANPTEDAVAPVFPFVLTGQTIDRAFYDHLNTYTGEMGSDGTVRVAGANLNATYVRLEQHVTRNDERAGTQVLKALGLRPDLDRGAFNETLHLAPPVAAAPTAFRLIKGASHVGSDNGILFAIKNDGKRSETVSAILRCLQVRNSADYAALCAEFVEETTQVYEAERLEKVKKLFGLRHDNFIHDAHALVIVRVSDDSGRMLTDFDLKLTGPKGTADDLPPGFLADRQKNSINRSTLTFFLNAELLYGTEAVDDVREKQPGIRKLGFRLYAYPLEGFVRYYPAIASAETELLRTIVQPHRTTLLDINLRRLVARGVLELDRLGNRRRPLDFREQPPGESVNLDPP